jgi:8-oxo-dGTP pyrophosphatase MutT (NUDIX family)
MSDPDELLDAFDDGLQLIGPTPRLVVHRDGLWHQVFHCLIVRTAPPARVLLQRRPRTARSFAALLDLSATGHLLAGEDPRDGVRELSEELGIAAASSDLVPLGRRLLVDDAGEGRNREIVNAFLLPLDTPLESFDLEGCDVAGIVEIDVAALLTILADDTAEEPCHELGTDRVVRPITCRAADLVPPVDGYWTVLAIMAERFIAGHSPLSI